MSREAFVLWKYRETVPEKPYLSALVTGPDIVAMT